MNEKKPRRWWLRFSLQSMFLTITALCCWLGWESHVVRARQAIIRECQANHSFQFMPAATHVSFNLPGYAVTPQARIPLVRAWLGDQAIQEIWYTAYGMHPPAEAELQRLKKAFPEAELRESVPIPCHPGCFPRGTEVETASGPRLIESLRPGDVVAAIEPGGEAASATVQSVFITRNRLWRVTTTEGALLTTQTQPLCLTTTRVIPAGELQPGDHILRREGKSLQSVKVLEIAPTDRTEKVFNVVLGDSEIFIAGGFLARSKPPLEVQ